MLAGLDKVPWRRLIHAYGRATDIPAILRALMDPEESVRQEAQFELISRIHHQGSIYEATTAVIPFLFELVQDPSVPDRAGILDVLAGVSAEWTPELRGRSTDPAASSLRFRSITRRFADERPHRQATHQAVEDGFPVLSELLKDPEISVRIVAAFVIETLMDRGSEATQTLLEMVARDREDWCRAAAILALGQLARVCPPGLVALAAGGRLREILAGDGSGPDERLCAGIALLHFGEADRLPQTLALVRSRLPGDLEHFSQLPSSRHARNLVSLMTDSLHTWPEARVAWIGECLRHADRDVIRAALSEAGALCREVRWGPSRFARPIAELANSDDEKIRGFAICELGRLGRTGIEHLRQLLQHPLEDVRTKAAEVLPRTGSQFTQPLTEWNESPPAELASVGSLRETIERYEGSLRWDDVDEVCHAVEQLGFHGQSAAGAGELIQRQIDLVNTKIYGNQIAASKLRLMALRALWKITHEVGAIVPHLIEALEPDRYGLLVIDQLRELGPMARDALPALHQMAKSEQRITGEGDFTGCIFDDETFQAAAREAIRTIER
jgi:HEAT repeat protein